MKKIKINRLVTGVLRSIEHVIYIHADHFEPSTSIPDLCERKLVIWLEDLVKLKIKPSLFIHPALLVEYVDNKISLRPSSNTPVIEKYLKQMEENGADIHLHIHHERWTKSDLTVEPWKTLLEKRIVTDQELLETYIVAAKQLFQNAGIDMSSWGFIHGDWALNASDRRVCNIESELIILKRNGCFGDFTFPAGRPRCNPRMSGIFSVPLRKRAKSYNTGLPLKIGGNNFQNNRFVIFYLSTSYYYVSLDGMLINKKQTGEYFRSVLKPENNVCPEDELDIVQEWLLNSLIIDRTLIIKTHCHSMNDIFWIDPSGIANKSPLFHIDHRKRMDLLEEILQENNVKLHYLGARDLYKFCLALDMGRTARQFFEEIK